MNELWVARDEKGGKVTIWRVQPEKYLDGCFDYRTRSPLSGFKELDGDWYPTLKPGECRELVMESEVSE